MALMDEFEKSLQFLIYSSLIFSSNVVAFLIQRTGIHYSMCQKEMIPPNYMYQTLAVLDSMMIHKNAYSTTHLDA